MIFKNSIFSSFLLFSIFIHFKSQTYTLHELDSIVYNMRKAGNYKASILFNINLEKKYKKVNNIEGEIATNINIATDLAILNRYEESLKYLNNIEDNLNKIKNPLLKSRVFNQYGRIYSEMALYELSTVKFNQSIKYIKLIEDEKIKNNYLYFVYSWKLGNFEKMKKIDSMHSMQKKCMSLSPHSLLYVTIAERYLKQNKHSDSVDYYLNKALKISDQFPLYQKGIIFLNYGKLYKLKNDNLKALDYYFQSLEIFKDIHRKKEEKDLYKLIAQCYKSLNNKEKTGEYLEKYSILSDSLNGNERKIVTIPIEKLLQEKQAQKKLLKYLFYATIFGIILLAFLTIHFVHKKYLKKQEQKNRILSESLKKSEFLRKKFSDNNNDIIQLALENNPFFLTRFKEAYPEFYENLNSNFPSLTIKDLKFCALLKLNLTNKDIVQCENLSIRTVETKKYRLKKKLDLSPRDDLYIWIQKQ